MPKRSGLPSHPTSRLGVLKDHISQLPNTAPATRCISYHILAKLHQAIICGAWTAKRLEISPTSYGGREEAKAIRSSKPVRISVFADMIFGLVQAAADPP